MSIYDEYYILYWALLYQCIGTGVQLLDGGKKNRRDTFYVPYSIGTANELGLINGVPIRRADCDPP